MACASQAAADPAAKALYGEATAARERPLLSVAVKDHVNAPTVDGMDATAYSGQAGDVTLVGQGIQAPMSVLGTDLWNRTLRLTCIDQMGKDVMGIEDGWLFTAAGRCYYHLSSWLKLFGRRKAAASLRTDDVVSADILEQTDVTGYVPKRLPRKLKWIRPRTLLAFLRRFRQSQWARRDPEATMRAHREEEQEQIKALQAIPGSARSVDEMATALAKRAVSFAYRRGTPIKERQNRPRKRSDRSLRTRQNPSRRHYTGWRWRCPATS